MTDQEFITYFKDRALPEKLRLDRATTQLSVREYVNSNLALMLADLKNTHARHRLLQIVNALENPYNGPEIPQL